MKSFSRTLSALMASGLLAGCNYFEEAEAKRLREDRARAFSSLYTNDLERNLPTFYDTLNAFRDSILTGRYEGFTDWGSHPHLSQQMTEFQQRLRERYPKEFAVLKEENERDLERRYETLKEMERLDFERCARPVMASARDAGGNRDEIAVAALAACAK